MGLVVKRHDMKRRAPTEFRDEAELFARQYSGHGDVVWVGAPVNCWQVRLTLAPMTHAYDTLTMARTSSQSSYMNG